MTRREVIWPMAAKIREDALTEVNSTQMVCEQLPPFFSQGLAGLMKARAYLWNHSYQGHSSVLDLLPLSSAATNSLFLVLLVCILTRARGVAYPDSSSTESAQYRGGCLFHEQHLTLYICP
jgi:hypothetical protein